MTAKVLLSRFKKIYVLLLFYLKGGVASARQLGVAVGKGCRIYVKDFGSEPYLIEIGDRVTVTAGVRFITHDGSGWLVKDAEGRRFRYGKIKIGDDVFIGIDSIIMPGVVIGDRVVVAAGSVVTKSIPSGSVVAGVPAKIIQSFDAWSEKVSSSWEKQSTFRNGHPSVEEIKELVAREKHNV